MKKFLKQGLLACLSFSLLSLPAHAHSPSPDIYTLEKVEIVLPASPLPEISFSAATHPQETTVFGLPVNEGPIDRSLRALLAAGLIGTGIYGLSTGNISTPVSASLLGVAAIPTLTAATGYCPLYQLVGLEYTF